MPNLLNYLPMLPMGGQKLRLSVFGIAAGIAGALFLAYCVHFDGKRRADPEYKKKVHQRRQREAEQLKQRIGEMGKGQPESSTKEDVERYFMLELQRGERLIGEQRVDEGLHHLANAIIVCAEPAALMKMLHSTLPPQMFHALMLRLQEMDGQSSSGESEANEAATANSASANGSSSSTSFDLE